MEKAATDTSQSGDAEFSSEAFLAEGCRRLIERCERLEATVSEKCAELEDETRRKEDAFRKLEELQRRWVRLKADYDKLSKSKLGRLTLWYWRIKDRRHA